MNYEHMVTGIFMSRPNRFIAHVLIKGDGDTNREVICHVKNTGRCRELLLPGVTVMVQFHPEAFALGRKTEYSLIGVWKKQEKPPPMLINMDSQAPNQVAFEWLHALEEYDKHSCPQTKPHIPFFKPVQGTLKREVTYGQSRIDLAFQTIVPLGQDKDIKQVSAFMEVKGVTLEEDGIAMFPDAPTLRGIKHLEELIHARQNGYEAFILFVIQMKGMKAFTPNKITQPEFAEVLIRAEAAGVHVLAYDCLVTENSMSLSMPVPIILT